MLIRFLFSILGQTERKMVHKTEIYIFLLLPLLVVFLYCCGFFKRRLLLVQSKPTTVLPPYQPQQHRNISDRVREPSIKFGNLLVSPYIKRRGNHVMGHFTYSLILSIYFSDTSTIRTAAILHVRQRRLPSNTRHAIPPN